MRLHLLVGAKMASVQAAPKHGLRRYGVPPGGPWDRESAWVANALLGNPLDAPVLEWALSALEFEMEGDEGLSVVGARRDSKEAIRGPSPGTGEGQGGGAAFQFWTQPLDQRKAESLDAGRTPAVQGSPLLRPGDPAIGSNGGGGEGLGERSRRESSIEMPSPGSGEGQGGGADFQFSTQPPDPEKTESPDAGGTPAVLGDAGRLPAVRWVPIGARGYLALPGGVVDDHDGNLAGRVVAANLCVLVGEATESLRDRPIRVTPGSQSDQLDLAEFTQASFRVEPQSNRIGIRLSGATLEPGPEMTSEPACHGTIQIGNSGQPIILGPDGPTIGGYPKIAVVCEADLDRLAQLRPGDEVHFEVVSMDQAYALRHEWQVKIQRRLAQIAAGREANARPPS
ncbi:MAG: hypothetical protein K1X67_18005 [Fimbriimonadaceae bacterium]|nr:hypothetical protein [Fimbriimonadaceae bacterium]